MALGRKWNGSAGNTAVDRIDKQPDGNFGRRNQLHPHRLASNSCRTTTRKLKGALRAESSISEQTTEIPNVERLRRQYEVGSQISPSPYPPLRSLRIELPRRVWIVDGQLALHENTTQFALGREYQHCGKKLTIAHSAYHGLSYYGLSSGL